MTYKTVSLWLPSFAITMQELAECFDAKVQDAIDHGFRPIGGVETAIFNGNLHLLQAMVREDEDALRILSSGVNGEAGQKAEVRATGTGSGGTKGVDTSENAGSPFEGVYGSGVGTEEQSPNTPASINGLQRTKRSPSSRKVR